LLHTQYGKKDHILGASQKPKLLKGLEVQTDKNYYRKPDQWRVELENMKQESPKMIAALTSGRKTEQYPA